MRPLSLLATASLVTSLSLAAPGARAADDDPWLGRDKALHFDLSLALASGAYGVSALKLDPMWQRAAVGGAFALTLGAAKELWDLSGHGDPSWKDFTWDVLGAAVGVGLALAIDALTRGASANDAPPRAGAAPLRVSF